eukprot:TRINITY_DN1151_c4_g1_i1.p1 TRINITY_DN1151_c4_g1~~TRINITY_DN1151_c4_g1_i1.p1  ORF type:complete len:148 (+),score=29.79 TRINITY_DN1151_c4_g1_i1:54-497(+)
MTDTLKISATGFVWVWDEKKWVPTTITATKNKGFGDGTTGLMVGKATDDGRVLFEGKFAHIYDEKPEDANEDEYVSSVGTVSQHRREFEPYPEGTQSDYSSNVNTAEFCIGDEDANGVRWKFATTDENNEARGDLYFFVHSAMFKSS